MEPFMTYMPVPNGSTIFLLLGNTVSSMFAGNIVTSIKDHMGETESKAICCAALVDRNFDREQALPGCFVGWL